MCTTSSACRSGTSRAGCWNGPTKKKYARPRRGSRTASRYPAAGRVRTPVAGRGGRFTFKPAFGRLRLRASARASWLQSAWPRPVRRYDAFSDRQVVFVFREIVGGEIHRADHAADDLAVHDVGIDDIHTTLVLLER